MGFGPGCRAQACELKKRGLNGWRGDDVEEGIGEVDGGGPARRWRACALKDGHASERGLHQRLPYLHVTL
jgi:hypothetical protein